MSDYNYSLDSSSHSQRTFNIMADLNKFRIPRPVIGVTTLGHKHIPFSPCALLVMVGLFELADGELFGDGEVSEGPRMHASHIIRETAIAVRSLEVRKGLLIWSAASGSLDLERAEWVDSWVYLIANEKTVEDHVKFGTGFNHGVMATCCVDLFGVQTVRVVSTLIEEHIVCALMRYATLRFQGVAS